LYRYNVISIFIKEALCAIEDRDKKVLECQQEIENDFVILGATAIEDKLQDKVDETIDLLKKAGIRVWVLTGDKTETATNIGYSSKLLDDNQEIFVIDVDEQGELEQRIEEINNEVKLFF